MPSSECLPGWLRRCRFFSITLSIRDAKSPVAAFARYPSLQDRAVLITGGATGIGMTLVEEFAAQGARTGFIDIDVPAAEALVARLGSARHVPVFVAADITDIDALDAAIAAVRARIGPI